MKKYKKFYIAELHFSSRKSDKVKIVFPKCSLAQGIIIKEIHFDGG